MTQSPGFPQHKSRFLEWLGSVGLRLLGGWEIQGEFPSLPRAIIVVAPHTSNWDFFVGLMVKFKLHLRVSFLAKHSLFVFPVKGFLQRIGGIAVRRDSAQGVVGQMVENFARRPQLVLVVTPEGTRKKVAQWKTGFLHIARKADVPVIPVAFDYARRCVSIGPTLTIKKDIGLELQRVQGYFKHATGKKPENA